MIKNHFSKELRLTKKDDENFENSTKCWICDNDYIDNDVKVKDYCHISGNYRGSEHRNCNINVELNQKIPVVFHNLKIYDSHLRRKFHCLVLTTKLIFKTMDGLALGY